jgi:hypothetical protein
MEAKVKCSNCGAELTDFNFSWGKKQWLWSLLVFVPFVVFVVWIQFWMIRSNQDFAKELQPSLTETRITKDKVDVVGTLRNIGSHIWDRVTVEAEFYDESGKFLDEVSQYLSVSLPPGADEHFRITLVDPSDQIVTGTPKVILKVTDADDRRF